MISLLTQELPKALGNGSGATELFNELNNAAFSMEPLTDILRSIRLSGTIFCRAVMAAPWSVHSNPLSSGIFHAVIRGRAMLQVDGSPEFQELEEGDIVFLPHGNGHIMCSEKGIPPIAIRSLPSAGRTGIADNLRIEGDGAATTIICGRFTFERSDIHPLLSVLPDIIHVKDRDDTVRRWRGTTLHMIEQELESSASGSEMIITRLSDILLIHALRRHIATESCSNGTWLAGLRDPRIAHALALIHREPHREWTAVQLSCSIGMSRSSFFALFTQLVGITPHTYLTRWRMHLAAEALRSGHETIAQIAEGVGYTSESAFSRTFKRIVGSAPGNYRRMQNSASEE